MATIKVSRLRPFVISSAERPAGNRMCRTTVLSPPAEGACGLLSFANDRVGWAPPTDLTCGSVGDAHPTWKPPPGLVTGSLFLHAERLRFLRTTKVER